MPKFCASCNPSFPGTLLVTFPTWWIWSLAPAKWMAPTPMRPCAWAGSVRRCGWSWAIPSASIPSRRQLESVFVFLPQMDRGFYQSEAVRVSQSRMFFCELPGKRGIKGVVQAFFWRESSRWCLTQQWMRCHGFRRLPLTECWVWRSQCWPRVATSPLWTSWWLG